MASGYWIMTFRSVSDPAGIDRYAAAAMPVIQAHGGRVLAAGLPASCYESGLLQRVAIVEFDSFKAADVAYRSAEYQAAVQHLVGTAERDVRIVEGI
ncbi:DUF1330 domain-containing protein [Dyella monticola]|uniref:DUF1330 domain-containing protein n=1 Tax=Dyella monticola TaxID=1927958 RepID=A0A370X1J9_9GAMM|nr:DUF1330 domain-containing protein [Dyella monticola]RDS82279.1 DUF1330 domain-containing protein [Dyella monticola]